MSGIDKAMRLQKRIRDMVSDLKRLYAYQKEAETFGNLKTGKPFPAIAIRTVVEGLELTLEDKDYTDCDASNEYNERAHAWAAEG